MDFGDYRQKVRRIAFYTIFGWISLATLVVVLMIWNVFEDSVLSNIVWSATAITVGILLGCITYFGFASAEDEDRPLKEKTDEEGDKRPLHDAFDRAKISSREG